MEYHGRIGSYWPQYQEGEIKNKGLNSRKHRCLSLRFVFAVAIFESLVGGEGRRGGSPHSAQEHQQAMSDGEMALS